VAKVALPHTSHFPPPAAPVELRALEDVAPLPPPHPPPGAVDGGLAAQGKTRALLQEQLTPNPLTPDPLVFSPPSPPPIPSISDGSFHRQIGSRPVPFFLFPLI